MNSLDRASRQGQACGVIDFMPKQQLNEACVLRGIETGLVNQMRHALRNAVCADIDNNIALQPHPSVNREVDRITV